MPSSLAPYAPYIAFAAIAVGLFALMMLVRHGVRRAGLGRRPVLLAALVLSALPALYVGLTWGQLLPESYVRFGRPWATLLGLEVETYYHALCELADSIPAGRG